MAIEIKACVINKATDATGANEADKAEAVEANEANDAEVAEANEADKAKATDANKADEANLPNEATDADEADEADSPDKAVDATEADKAEAIEANKADEAEAIDAAIVLFFIIANILIVIPRSLLDEGIVFIIYSLTKYSAILAEVKAYFGIFVFNNQLVGMVWNCLRSLKCQHLQRADIEDGKLLSSSMRVQICFVLSL